MFLLGHYLVPDRLAEVIPALRGGEKLSSPQRERTTAMPTANIPTANKLPLLTALPHVIGGRRIVGFRPPVARYSRATD